MTIRLKNNIVVSYTNRNEEGGIIVDSVPPMIPSKILCYNEESKEFYYKDNVNYASFIERQNLKQELEGIRKWLFDNDWKCNKIVIGEWQDTDERWQTYLAERTEKRARQDEILALLGGA